MHTKCPLLRALFLLACSLLPLRSADLELFTPPPIYQPGSPALAFGLQITPDGRHVLFLSGSPNLATNKTNGRVVDLFLKDRETGAVELVSQSTNGLSGAEANVEAASMSADARYVVFQTTATNLVGSEPQRFPTLDLFLRDRSAGKTVHLSKLVSARRYGNSSDASIADDGSVVVFKSDAESLAAGDMNNVPDIYAYYPATQKLELASVGPGKAVPDQVSGPVLSRNGRMAAFAGFGTNMFTGRLTNAYEVYARDLSAKTTHWVSSNISRFFHARFGPSSTPVSSTEPQVSADGRVIYFKAARGPGGAMLFRWDSEVRSAAPVGDMDHGAGLDDASRGPSVSADGAVVAFVHTNRLMVAVEGGSPVPLTTWTNGGIANRTGRLFSPMISADGRVISFLSNYAYSDSPTAPEAGFQICRLDRTDGLVSVVSATPAMGAVKHAGEPLLNDMTSDGRFVLFGAEGAPFGAAAGRLEFPGVYVFDAATGVPEAVSNPPGASATPFNQLLMTQRAASADGRVVVFTTTHAHSAMDTNGFLDVYARHVAENRTTLVSMSSNGVGRSASYDAVISPNGRHVAFLSPISNFQPGAFTNRQTIFIKDLETGALIQAHDPNAGPSSEPLPGSYSFNADGTHFAYETRNGLAYILSLSTGERTGLMTNSRGEIHGAAFLPLFNALGDAVYFYSSAPDIVEPSASGYHLYRRALRTGETARVGSISDIGNASRPKQLGLALSTNGVSLMSASNSIWRLEDGDTNRTLLCTACDQPALSPDGRFVAYRRFPTFNAGGRIRLRAPDGDDFDLPSVSTVVLGSQPQHGLAQNPVFSPDNSRIIYSTQKDASSAGILFVYDLNSRRLQTLIEAGGTNDPAHFVAAPNFSADGQKLFFTSSVPFDKTDLNGTSDIFAFDLGAATRDSDADGLPDQWEVAFFGNLDQSGSTDFDQDGHTNAEEFAAGTNPTLEADLLEIVSWDGLLNDRREIRWRSKPGKSYVVEAKSDLTKDWAAISPRITTSGLVGQFSEGASGAVYSQTFYRVRLVE